MEITQQLVDGVWYYFDPVNCNMWFNCVTPDGYQLGFNGESMGKVQ